MRGCLSVSSTPAWEVQHGQTGVNPQVRATPLSISFVTQTFPTHNYRSDREDTMTTTHPAAPLTSLTQHRGVWSLAVACPNCGHEHYHGGGTELAAVRDYLGHRAAHCSTICSAHPEGHKRGNGYVLTDPRNLIGTAMAEAS